MFCDILSVTPENVEELTSVTRVTQFGMKIKGFLHFFLSQVSQAQCMKTETEHYRRLQSELVQVRFFHCYVQ